MLLVSRRWTTPDKVLGAIAYTVLGAPALLLAGLSLTLVGSTEGCTQQMDEAGGPVSAPVCTSNGTALPPWLLVVGAVAWLAFHIYVPVRLARQARLRQPT